MRYLVFGYDDMCVEFSKEFDSLVQAARLYLRLERAGMCVVFFSDTTKEPGKLSRVEKRLMELR